MARSIQGNRGAFLDMLAQSEGTSTITGSDDGYNVIVGGKLFSSYADHPRQLVVLNKAGLESTAAGRYQVLEKYFDYYKKLLNLPDFSPASQDSIAIQQIKESGALQLIDNGNLLYAITKCNHIWASLPGNSYGQRQNSIDSLQAAYVKAGGIISA
jgi:muramidase (phage lysozyme)